MVYIARFIGAAAVLSSLNLAVALPQPGGEVSQESGYGSSSYGSGKSNYGSSNSGYDSSKGSSKGYDSSNDSSKGSYNSGYGSSKDSGYYGDKTTTSSKIEETSTVMYESTSTIMYESSSSTETAAASSTSVMYGSGSMNSGSSGYDDCVAQCIASFSPTSTASSVNSGSNSGSVGTGATKTVIVAPSQGVLRYVPFAVNASVGDTIKFVWKAGPHTVTKGSALEPCNATSDNLFNSDKQNVGFEFTQEVTSTEPTFYFCGLPNHCQKGMFGVINPPSNLNAPTSASGMMQSLKAKSSDLKAYAAITDANTSGKPAATWGGSIDMSGMPDWAQPLAAENILYTRNVLANNPELLQENGVVDMSSADTVPLMYPKDVSDALKDAATATPGSNSTGTPANAAGAAATTSATSATSAPTSGAALTTPRAVLALVAVAATVLMI